MYRLLLVIAQVNGDLCLVYGEAVECFDASPSAPVESHPSPSPTSAAPLKLTVLRGVLPDNEVKKLEGQLAGKSLSVGAFTVKTGEMVKRPTVLLPVAFGIGGDAEHLHPDGRFTYQLDEWWDSQEHTLRTLWETRVFKEIGEAIEADTGLALHQMSARVGNFLRFKRLSPWYLDSRPDNVGQSRWIRPISDVNAPSSALALHVRFVSGTETVGELLRDVDASGTSVPVHQDYSTISVSLFDKQTGMLLAREYGSVFGPVSISAGHSVTSPPVTDSKNTTHSITWVRMDERGDRISAREPWNARTRRAKLRSEMLRESSKVALFKSGQREQALTFIRALLKDDLKEFIYIWDPYFDRTAAQDFLPWIPEWVHCKILCGARDNEDAAASPAQLTWCDNLKRQIQALRSSSGTHIRQIEGKFRVTRDKKKPWRHIYHDRFLITAGAAWMLGNSLKSIGTNTGAVIRLLNPDPLRWVFEDEYARVHPQEVTL